jgi:hypothetical protein
MQGAGDGDALALSTGISLGLWFMRSPKVHRGERALGAGNALVGRGAGIPC